MLTVDKWTRVRSSSNLRFASRSSLTHCYSSDCAWAGEKFLACRSRKMCGASNSTRKAAAAAAASWLTALSHYWKQEFCRVQTVLPSVKNRVLGKNILCRVPHSTKNCTRQKRILGKGLLCRVPGSRQKRGTRHRLPRVTVFGHVLLCRVPAFRHSAKFFFEKYFAECP